MWCTKKTEKLLLNISQKERKEGFMPLKMSKPLHTRTTIFLTLSKSLPKYSLHTKHAKPKTTISLSFRHSLLLHSTPHLLPKGRACPVRGGRKAASPHHWRPGRRRRWRRGRCLERMGQEIHTLIQFRSAPWFVQNGHVRDPGGDDEAAYRPGFRVCEAPAGRQTDSGNPNLLFPFVFLLGFSLNWIGLVSMLALIVWNLNLIVLL